MSATTKMARRLIDGVRVIFPEPIPVWIEHGGKHPKVCVKDGAGVVHRLPLSLNTKKDVDNCYDWARQRARRLRDGGQWTPYAD